MEEEMNTLPAFRVEPDVAAHWAQRDGVCIHLKDEGEQDFGVILNALTDWSKHQ
jgi:hypothetical protein